MSNPVENLSESSRNLLDVASLGWLVAVFLANLPAVTAGLSAIWVCLRIYQSWQEIRLNRHRLKKEASE